MIIGKMQTSSKSNFYGSNGVNNIFQDYFADGYAEKKWLFFEILRLYMILCDYQFFELKSRHRSNRFCMASIA